MGKFSKALEIIGVTPKDKDEFEDDYFEDDYTDDSDVRGWESRSKSTVSGSGRSDRYSRSRSAESRRDVLDDILDAEPETEEPYPIKRNKTRLSAMRGGAVNAGRTMVIHAPASYIESQSLVLQLKQNKQVIIKLDTIEKEIAQRILDFMSGAAFALECQVIKISKGIYLFASNDTCIENPEEEPQDEQTDDFYSVDDSLRRR